MRWKILVDAAKIDARVVGDIPQAPDMGETFYDLDAVKEDE